MSRSMLAVAAVVAALAATPAPSAVGMPAGEPRTICTVTLNSDDEALVLRARLSGRFRFVELVDPADPGWLAAACKSDVRCDALVVSGHFNAGDSFYAAAFERTERLHVDALEAAACGDACAPIFSRLQAVYLFGCLSLNRDAANYASAHGDSGYARMRRIFAGVPSLYGFQGQAPAGALAASSLERYFDAGGGARFGTGLPDEPLLRAFSHSTMVRVSGAGPREAPERARACRFFDPREATAGKVSFAHGLLRDGDGDAALRRIGALLASIGPVERREPAVAAALARLAADKATRALFLRRARAMAPAERARRIELAEALGWLDATERAAETRAVAREVLEAGVPGSEDVALVCDLARGGSAQGVAALASKASPGSAAIRACLGEEGGRSETLALLATGREADVKVAQAWLRTRPRIDADELRRAVAAVAAMAPSMAQVRALEALARLPLGDGVALEGLARAFAATPSAAVQEAIAEVLLRAGYRSPALASLVRDHRLAAPGRGPLVDALAAVADGAS